jgi:MoxR-like ATPase
MASKTSNLNVDIFCALKASEVSGIPVLLLGNPGIGKTVSVYHFAKIRGYETVLLRGNSSTPEEIMGYDTAPHEVTYEKPMAALHLRPSWFEEILRNHEAGKRSLLFLDEITTAHEFVQAALLHLIFERKVGRESLPEDTLIVSAGNYSGNLSNTMALMPPVMNRFMIYNITADHNDLDIFLNKYEGAIANPDGKCKDYMKDLEKALERMDAQESKVSESLRNKIGEYIERSIKDTTRMLITTTKEIDLTITDLKDIYQDADDEAKLCGFVSFRTLNYLRDISVAWYLCFGKQGIASKNFRNAVDGLCGIGISRGKGSSGENKTNHVGKNYYDALVQTANEIEKLKNDKLPEYVKFFSDTIAGKTILEVAEINALQNKVKELMNDKDLKNIDKPVDHSMIATMFDLIKATASKYCGIRVSTTGTIATKYSDTEIMNAITRYNQIEGFTETLGNLISEEERHYDTATSNLFSEVRDNISNVGFKLRAIKKMLSHENPSLASMLPEIANMK